MLDETGLTPQQYGVLIAMKYNKQPVTVTTLARLLDRNTNSISMMVDRMERNALVERVENPQDRRSMQLMITPKGNQRLYQATRPFWGLVKRMMACWSEEELLTATRLVENLRQQAFDELGIVGFVEEVHIEDDDKIARLLAEIYADG